MYVLQWLTKMTIVKSDPGALPHKKTLWFPLMSVLDLADLHFIGFISA
jgi:hypothetical protein